MLDYQLGSSTKKNPTPEHHGNCSGLNISGAVYSTRFLSLNSKVLCSQPKKIGEFQNMQSLDMEMKQSGYHDRMDRGWRLYMRNLFRVETYGKDSVGRC